VTHFLSVFRWDVSCGEVVVTVQSQAFPSMGGFITRVLVNFDGNLTH
jgi:hypothetical protein